MNLSILVAAMLATVKETGLIYSGNAPKNQLYLMYKRKIETFIKSRGLIQRDYAPYQVLNALYFTGSSYSVNLSEAQMIHRTIVDLKHELFPDCFEEIFISHREKDRVQVDAFIELLHGIGIPRSTEAHPNRIIFCTSSPPSYIANGKKNLEEIRGHLNSDKHTFCILWFTDGYFESPACLNETGAIWVLNKKYQVILSPNFDSDKIGGLLDPQQVWFKANNKHRLNLFKEQLEAMFGLEPLLPNEWEIMRDKFVAQLSE